MEVRESKKTVDDCLDIETSLEDSEEKPYIEPTRPSLLLTPHQLNKTSERSFNDSHFALVDEILK